MHSFFDVMAPWVRNSGALHVYALPDDDVADRVVTLQGRLEEVPHLPLMPREWLHFTVSQLPQFDDLPQREFTRLGEAITAGLEGVEAFDLKVGPPVVGETSVLCWAAPSNAWDLLVARVRAAVAPLAMSPMPAPPQAAHVSLGYATGDVSDSDLAARLADAPPLGTVPVRKVFLTSVTVRPELGIFDFAELAAWPLG